MAATATLETSKLPFLLEAIIPVTDPNKKMIVVVNGQSGSGKTFCANELAIDLGIPRLSQDEFKELLFDTFGNRRHFHSKLIERASFELMLATADNLLHNCDTVIIEATFNPVESPPMIAEIATDHSAELLQFYLKTDYLTRIRRITKRQKSPKRHAGHRNLKNRIMLPIKRTLSELGYRGSQRHRPLEMECQSIEIDTTEFGSLNYVELFRKLHRTRAARNDISRRARSMASRHTVLTQHAPWRHAKNVA